ARFERGAVRGVKPYDAAAPAKSRDRDAFRVAVLRLRPRDRAVQVVHDLFVGDLRGDLGDDLLAVGDLRDVTLAREQVGRDRQIAELREAPADVTDVLVHAEDLVHHQHDGRGAFRLRGTRTIAGDLARLRGDADVGDRETLAARDDRRCRYRPHRQREPGTDRAGDHLAPGELGPRHAGSVTTA